MGEMDQMEEMDPYQNKMDPRCRKDMPDRPAPANYRAEDYVQSTVTDPMSQHQYGEQSRSPLRQKSS